MTRIVFIDQILRDLVIRQTPAEPGQVPGEKGDDDEKPGDDYQPDVRGSPWFLLDDDFAGTTVGIYEFIFHVNI